MGMAGQKSNRWREYCNPLRGLTMQRLMSLIEAGERGEYADLQWLYHYMERSDPVIYSVLQRRRAALLDCDWDVRIVAPATGRGSRESGVGMPETGNLQLETGESGSKTGNWKPGGERSTHNAQLTTLNGKTGWLIDSSSHKR